MGQEAHKAIVRRYIEMWNTGNAAIADAVLAPTYVDHAHPEVTSIRMKPPHWVTPARRPHAHGPLIDVPTRPASVR